MSCHVTSCNLVSPLAPPCAFCVHDCFRTADAVHPPPQIQSEVGAATAARHAAGRIFRLHDDEFPIDPLGEDGAKGPSGGCAVRFSNVKFAYPQRPDARVRVREGYS